MNLIARAAEAGVIGAGGAGFPTNVKLAGAESHGVDVVIANGAECEPLLHKDQALMIADAERVVRGLLAVREATGAREAVVATKAKYDRAESALSQAIARIDPGIRLALLEDFYPAGDEVVLIAEVSGRVVPAGQLPMAVGAAVFNVESLANLASATDGEPVIDKQVTVTGAVANPGNLTVPIGTSLADLLAKVGALGFPYAPGLEAREPVIIVGGPLMGLVVGGRESSNQVVSKKTAGFVVLPPGHQRARWARVPLLSQLTRAASACCGCCQCTDLCPRALLGHPLRPHEVMLRAGTVRTGLDRLSGDQAAAWFGQVFLCSECGLCEVYACPMGLSPRQVNVHLKHLLRAAGLPGRAAPPSSQRSSAPAALAAGRTVPAGRRVPVKRLTSRLGLLTPPFQAEPVAVRRLDGVSEVRIPLTAHAGPAAEAVVAPGEPVRRGQVVGRALGKDGVLWTQVHASIDGVVAAVTPVEISIKCR